MEQNQIIHKDLGNPWGNQGTMVDTLTNVGPVGVAPPMNLPGLVEAATPGLAGPTPPVMQLLGEYDEYDEEEQDTDPFFYNNNNIFEESGFLGIAIGKKAKARKAVRKAARIEKRQLRKQSKNQALSDAQTALENARNISVEAVPQQLAQAPILPDSGGYMPPIPPMYNPYDAAMLQDDPLVNQPISYSPAREVYANQMMDPAGSPGGIDKGTMTWLKYGGIAAAVVIALILITKK